MYFLKCLYYKYNIPPPPPSCKIPMESDLFLFFLFFYFFQEYCFSIIHFGEDESPPFGLSFPHGAFKSGVNRHVYCVDGRPQHSSRASAKPMVTSPSPIIPSPNICPGTNWDNILYICPCPKIMISTNRTKVLFVYEVHVPLLVDIGNVSSLDAFPYSFPFLLFRTYLFKRHKYFNDGL